MEHLELKNIQDKALFAELLRRYKCMARPFGSAAILASDKRDLRSYSYDIAEMNCWCLIDPKDFGISEASGTSGTQDDLLVQKVLDRVKEPICNHGAIFNGFPQNLYQAQKFERGLTLAKVKVDRVIELNAKVEEDLTSKEDGQGKNGFREVIEFYKAQGRVVTMDGDKSKEYISSQMKSLFSKGLYNKFD